MQGTILSVAGQGGQGLILGEDGARYTYTPMGWRDSTVSAFSGMTVDFEIRGAHAVGVYPLPGQTPPPPPPIATPVAPSPYAPQPPQQTTGMPATPVYPVSHQASVQPQPAQPTTGMPATPVYPASHQAPVQPQPTQVTQINVGVPTEAAQQQSPDRVGKIIAGVAWMFLLSAFLSLFLPVIGGLIGGFVGGRKAGDFVNSAIAALISAVAIGGITFAAVSMIVSFIEGLPVIGFFIMATPLGDLLKSGAVIVALANALPMLLFALLGGATAKK